MRKISLFLLVIICFLAIPDFIAAEENYPLYDESQTPELEIAKSYFINLFPANNFNENYGSIGDGVRGIKESYKLFTSGYQSKVSLKDYLNSFQNKGAFRLLQLYSAGPEGASGVSAIGKCVYFEFSFVEDAEKTENNLYLGSGPLTYTGGSKKTFHGFMYFLSEFGKLKINKIKYIPEFPCGGGHMMGRQDHEEVARLSLPDLPIEERLNTENVTCKTRIVHRNNLVYVTCTYKNGITKTAKLAHPSDAGDEGWICIQIK